MGKAKILHLVEDLNVGGLERVLATIVLNLPEDDYDVRVWCLAQGGPVADDLSDSGINVKVLGLKNYHNPLNLLKLAYFIKKANIDVIHAHGYFAGTFGRLAAILVRVPKIIVHVHTTYYKFKFRHLCMENFLARFTDKIICVSEATQEFVNNVEGISRDKTCLIYNGCGFVPETRNSMKAAELSRSFSQSDFVIATVASLVPHKGHRWLIGAVKNLAEKYANLKLIIIGDGPLKSSLETMVADLKLTAQIKFAGLQKDVRSFLKMSNAFVLPSIEREGLGLALIEAMAMGLPIIGSNIGGIPEVIEDNVNGFLVEPNNLKDLSGAIERLILNPESRARMGLEGQRRYTRMFTVDEMMKKIKGLYQEQARLDVGA